MTPFTLTNIQIHPAFKITLSALNQGYILIDPTGKKWLRFANVTQTVPPTLPTGWSWYTDPQMALNSIESVQGSLEISYGKDEGYNAIVDDQNNMYIHLPFGLLWA